MPSVISPKNEAGLHWLRSVIRLPAIGDPAFHICEAEAVGLQLIDRKGNQIGAVAVDCASVIGAPLAAGREQA